jgi:hypothetical protein
MKILVYNNWTNRVETYWREASEAMPYNTGRTLLAGEFRGQSQGGVLWTDRRYMETWNAFRAYYGRPIYVQHAFRRIWEGGHGAMSQHYAGGAFDVAQNQTAAVRQVLHSTAVRFGGWSYVEPLYLTPTWVHFDKRLFPPACAVGGYILVRNGSRGVYVLVMQDALNAVGFTGGGLDGIFGSGTQNAVMRFQRANGLAVDGIVGCQPWQALTSQAVGIGQPSTVVDP